MGSRSLMPAASSTHASSFTRRLKTRIPRSCKRCAISARKFVCTVVTSTERAATAEGFRYVHSANEPLLIAGVGTIGLEIFEDLPDVDVIIAPAGGGSCASGNCLVAQELNANVKVIAVQSEGAPAMWHAWRNRNLDPYPTMN